MLVMHVRVPSLGVTLKLILLREAHVTSEEQKRAAVLLVTCTGEVLTKVHGV